MTTQQALPRHRPDRRPSRPRPSRPPGRRRAPPADREGPPPPRRRRPRPLVRLAAVAGDPEDAGARARRIDAIKRTCVDKWICWRKMPDSKLGTVAYAVHTQCTKTTAKLPPYDGRPPALPILKREITLQCRRPRWDEATAFADARSPASDEVIVEEVFSPHPACDKIPHVGTDRGSLCEKKP